MSDPDEAASHLCELLSDLLFPEFSRGIPTRIDHSVP